MSEDRRTSHTALVTCSARCGSFEVGHELHPIRVRAAAATSTRWIDAMVVSAASSGAVELAGVFTGDRHTVWSHHDAARALRPGEAVALHEQYGILSIGRTWWSVRSVDRSADSRA